MEALKKYGLIVIAFTLTATAFVKLQKSFSKKSSAKKVTALTLTQWPSVMKKSKPKFKAYLPPKEANKAVWKGQTTPITAVHSGYAPARGIASVNTGVPAFPTGTQVAKLRPRGYASAGGRGGQYANFNYGNASVESIQAAYENSKAARSTVAATASQELSSFTRTPDLSMNAAIDPEISESFEDQVRKLREQNQLTSQQLQELENIVNNFNSMSSAVQRGVLPMPQVNAEAIKITRSFINLKRRVTSGTQIQSQ